MAKPKAIIESSDEEHFSSDPEEEVEDIDEVDEEMDLEEDEEESEESEESEIDSRMTERQRNKHNGTQANIGLMDLAEIEGTNRPKKNQLSLEEQRIKRAEMARRRRNLSQQRLEEEKKETLDKLLKKRAKKVRGSEDAQDPKQGRSKLLPMHPAFSRWTCSKTKSTLEVLDSKRLDY